MTRDMHLYLIPASIVIAGALIGSAIFFSSGSAGGDSQLAGAGAEQQPDEQTTAAQKVAPVARDDHARGNPDAPVTIIEFSDFECPFCARVHPTLSRVLDEYDGKVRWVYRHFPLSSIHPNAEPAARASECIASLGGNDAFWAFADQVFSGGLTLSSGSYAAAAAAAGINADAFASCLDDPDTAQAVSNDLSDATQSGARGTPHMIVLNKKGEPFPFSGALPYEQVADIINRALE